MAEPARRASRVVYEHDFAAWLAEQAHLLRMRSTAGLDWDHLAEELEELGGSGRSEIRNRMTILLLHLLKWQFQPAERTNSWAASILEQRQRIGDVIGESPSLRSFPAGVIEREYRIARLNASGETKLPVERFPAACPYAIDDILDESFLPGRADG